MVNQNQTPETDLPENVSRIGEALVQGEYQLPEDEHIRRDDARLRNAQGYVAALVGQLTELRQASELDGADSPEHKAEIAALQHELLEARAGLQQYSPQHGITQTE